MALNSVKIPGIIIPSTKEVFSLAVMAVFKYQDEKIISLETGATKIPK
jgi:hypothetical protein